MDFAEGLWWRGKIGNGVGAEDKESNECYNIQYKSRNIMILVLRSWIRFWRARPTSEPPSSSLRSFFFFFLNHFLIAFPIFSRRRWCFSRRFERKTVCVRPAGSQIMLGIEQIPEDPRELRRNFDRTKVWKFRWINELVSHTRSNREIEGADGRRKYIWYNGASWLQVFFFSVKLIRSH